MQFGPRTTSGLMEKKIIPWVTQEAIKFLFCPDYIFH